jgi:hypothetical protein
MSMNRHDRTLEILYGICKSNAYYTRVYGDLPKTGYRPIAISLPKNKGAQTFSYEFRPDLWARLQKGGVDVIEIWDEQSEAGAFQDFLLAALTPGIARFSVICFDQKTVERCRTVATLVLSLVHDDQGHRLLDPSEVCRRVVSVPESSQDDDTRLASFLRKELVYLRTPEASNPRPPVARK